MVSKAQARAQGAGGGGSARPVPTVHPVVREVGRFDACIRRCVSVLDQLSPPAGTAAGLQSRLLCPELQASAQC